MRSRNRSVPSLGGPEGADGVGTPCFLNLLLTREVAMKLI